MDFAAIFLGAVIGANAIGPCTRAPGDLKPIMRTHTAPPYLPESRLEKAGTTRLRVTVGTNGTVTDITIDKSGGWDLADAAVLKHVKDRWRWKPSRRGCAVIKVQVSWRN